MQPEIKMLDAKMIVGVRKRMSFANNATRELWQNFTPKRKAIKNTMGTELFSIEVYDNPHFFSNFSPAAEFDKWAAVEVTNLDDIPNGMDQLKLPAGLYAIFIHKGSAREGQKTYEYIFNTWLPDSNFVLDDRPHLAIMGSRYKNDDPESEEEIAIPIRPK